jgi:hypothetical protein
MSIALIDGALVQAYIDIGQGLSTAYEGIHFEPPHNANWAAVFQLPAGSPPATLGVGGQDEHTGVLQINYNIKPGTGRSQLYTYAQAALTKFVAGRSFSSSGQYVTIESSGRTPIRAVDGWLRISVNVNWIARTTRPEI